MEKLDATRQPQDLESAAPQNPNLNVVGPTDGGRDAWMTIAGWYDSPGCLFLSV